MRIREGSQAKTGMAEEKETKGIDYQTWEFTGREYLEIAGISLGIAAASSRKALTTKSVRLQSTCPVRPDQSTTRY